MPIAFHTENIGFALKDKLIIRKWIIETCRARKKKAGNLNFIFCDDNYLHRINLDYLIHDTYTDIITFDYCTGDLVEGDLFISTERVQDNAKEIGLAFALELKRVMIHGILHLLGYRDKSVKEKATMRKAEDDALLALNALSVPRGTL